MKNTDDLRRMREMYEAQAVPDGLSEAVESAIGDASVKRTRRAIVHLRRASAIAAAAVATFVLLLNTNPAFAAAMADTPVIGGICRVVTFAKYDRTEKFDHLRVRIPEIADTGDDALENRVNLEIRYQIENELKAARVRAEEYYEAFIATGGKPEEFVPMEIFVDYEIKTLTEETVSFVIYKEESLAAVYGQVFCYNVDLDTGRYLTLRDVLGDSYKQRVLDAIDRRIASDSELAMYVFDSEVDIPSLIDEDRMFYLKDDGKTAVVIFDKYEIAAGAAGRPEFEITIDE